MNLQTDRRYFDDFLGGYVIIGIIMGLVIWLFTNGGCALYVLNARGQEKVDYNITLALSGRAVGDDTFDAVARMMVKHRTVAERHAIADVLVAIAEESSESVQVPFLTAISHNPKAAQAFANASKPLAHMDTFHARELGQFELGSWGFLGISLLPIVFFWMACSFLYISHDNDERFADLPWRKFWPWMFVLVTFPWTTLFILGSVGKVLSGSDRKEWLFDVGILTRNPHAEEDDSRYPPLTDRPLITLELPSEDLTQKWQLLESQITHAKWERGCKEWREKLSHDEAALRTAGNAVRESQKRIMETKKNLARLETAEPTQEDSQKTREESESELEMLYKLQNVKRVEVDEGHIKITVAPVIVTVQNRSYYDLGDYQIDIPIDSSWFSVNWLYRTSRHGYALLYGDGEHFCAGQRNGVIQTALQRHQWVVAASLIIEAMHHVNPDDYEKVQTYYQEVEQP